MNRHQINSTEEAASFSQTAGLRPSFAHVNGITMRYVQQGTGRLVLLLHGFPEYLHSWRAQIHALADAGYSAVAVDLRGYGESSAPPDPTQYSHLHLIGDIVGLIDHLGYRSAVVVGHDMGAHLAWALATVLPQRVDGIVALSVPLRARGDEPPLTAAARNISPDFYQLRFQPPAIAEADLDNNVDRFLPGIFDGLSGSAENPVTSLVVPAGQSFSDLFAPPARTPTWLSDSDLDAYVTTFRRSGFAGAVNWYRNIDLNWELTSGWASEQVQVPALYVAGDRDVAYVGAARSGALGQLPDLVPGLVESVVLPGCGHWTNQECPDEVNESIVSFCDTLFVTSEVP